MMLMEVKERKVVENECVRSLLRSRCEAMKRIASRQLAGD